MKSKLVIAGLALMLVACGTDDNKVDNTDRLAPEEKPADSTSSIDTIINQDTLLDYDGKRL